MSTRLSAYVKIGRKTLSGALTLLRVAYSGGGPATQAVIAEVEAALRPSSKATRAKSARRQEKKARKATKREAFRDVRALVVERAEGRCECGHHAPATGHEADHFWGRARAESVESVWLLNSLCHKSKTLNQPSRAHWLQLFANHCDRHGYATEAAKARRELEAMAAISAAAGVMAHASQQNPNPRSTEKDGET